MEKSEEKRIKSIKRVERVKECMKLYGLKQKDIAEKILISESYISLILTGKAPLTYSKASDMVRECFPGVRPEWLIGNSEYMNDEWEAMEKGFSEIVSLQNSFLLYLDYCLCSKGLRLEFVFEDGEDRRTFRTLEVLGKDIFCTYTEYNYFRITDMKGQEVRRLSVPMVQIMGIGIKNSIESQLNMIDIY